MAQSSGLGRKMNFDENFVMSKKSRTFAADFGLRGRIIIVSNEVNILWQKCLTILEDNLSASAFRTWFKPLVPLSYENNVLVLQVQSQFVANYIEENYIELLSKVLFKVFGPETQLQYKVLVDSTSGASATMPSANHPKPVNDLDAQLNPAYTFDTFVAGEANKLARTAGLTIAQRPGNTAFNPLFVYGGSGVGKTHLANAIGNLVRQLHPDKRVVYVSANTFKLQYQDAALNHKIPDFLNFYQQMDVLIVDDIQYFSGLKGTQDTFFHIFNYLQQSHKQLILTSDRSPLQLKDIEDRLLTRFKWGLSAEILRPDYALRRDILVSKMRHDGFELPDDVIDFIAANVMDSIRDLEGILASLLAYATLDDRELNMALAEEVVSRIVAIKPKAIDMSDIVGAVSEHYNLQPKTLLSNTRLKEVTQARHIAMYLSKQMTEHSLNEIGQYMGKRSHATVLHAYRQMQDQLELDPVLRQTVKQIQSVIIH